MRRWLALGVGLVGLLGVGARAAAEEKRNTVWYLGMNGERHLLKSGEGNHLLGSSLEVQLGRGYIGESWYGTVSVDIISGPYEPVEQKTQSLDYLGTGITMWWGYNAEPVSIRTDKGNYGFSLGLSYADIVGRSVGERRFVREVPGGKEETEVVDDYVMRVTDFALIPAIFFCWLKEPRVLNNKPENLMTRIEGYLLTIGVAMPLIASYQVKYKSTKPDKTGQTDPPLKTEPVSVHGGLRGYSLVVSFSVLLGI